MKFLKKYSWLKPISYFAFHRRLKGGVIITQLDTQRKLFPHSYNLKLILTTYFFLFFGIIAQAQTLTDGATLKTSTKIDSTTLFITQHFEAEIILDLTVGTRFDSSQEVCVYDTAFDIVTTSWLTDNGTTWKQKIYITPWDTGKLQLITQAKVKTDNDSDFKIIRDTMYFNARYPLSIDTMKQILPIKDIVEEPTNFWDYVVQFAFPAIVTVAIMGLFWYLFKQYKQRRENKKNYRGPYVSPYVKAIKNIDALPIPRIMTEVDNFFNKVSKEVRQALYDAENIFAFQNTTSETVMQLQLKKFTPAQIETLKQILSSADMVKFAQMQPPQTICSDFKNTVIALLRELENGKK